MSNMPNIINPGQGFQGFNVPRGGGSTPAGPVMRPPPEQDPGQMKKMEELRKEQVRIERSLAERQSRYQSQIARMEAEMHSSLVQKQGRKASEFRARMAELSRKKRQAEQDMAKAGVLHEIKRSALTTGSGEGDTPGIFMSKMQKAVSQQVTRDKKIFEQVAGAVIKSHKDFTRNEELEEELERTFTTGSPWMPGDPSGLGVARVPRGTWQPSDDLEGVREKYGLSDEQVKNAREIMRRDGPEAGREYIKGQVFVQDLGSRISEAIGDLHDREKRGPIRQEVNSLLGALATASSVETEEQKVTWTKTAGEHMKVLRDLGVGDVELSAVVTSLDEAADRLVSARQQRISEGAQGEENLNKEQIEEILNDPTAMMIQEMGSWMRKLPEFGEEYAFDRVSPEEKEEMQDLVPELIAELSASGMSMEAFKDLDPEVKDMAQRALRHTITAMRQQARESTEVSVDDVDEKFLMQDLDASSDDPEFFGERIAALEETGGLEYTEFAQGLQEAQAKMRERAAEEAARLSEEAQGDVSDIAMEGVEFF